MAKQATQATQNIDDVLGVTRPRQHSATPPTPPRPKPLGLALKDWASSQVAAYRVGLVLGYLAMMFFGASAWVAGIPAFTFTAPEGWTPIWGSIVVLGGLIGGIGALHAGAEPVTPEVKVFNRIELTGAIMLFLTLGTYATILLILGYGYGDPARASVGAGFVALGVAPTVRMVWLIFRPRLLTPVPSKHAHSGPILLVPEGYTLVKKSLSSPSPETVSNGLKGV